MKEEELEKSYSVWWDILWLWFKVWDFLEEVKNKIKNLIFKK